MQYLIDSYVNSIPKFQGFDSFNEMIDPFFVCQMKPFSYQKILLFLQKIEQKKV
jgi:hypothetical protein